MRHDEVAVKGHSIEPCQFYNLFPCIYALLYLEKIIYKIKGVSDLKTPVKHEKGPRRSARF